ncbi:PH domain-containing protein [Bacillaceae bacterium SIJ1]|uniref:PH domain-containing protein n=1 Tax=Litoribacterium kuwaitense TaxID=1398745 RepID=UPI0013EC3881|nr:PH domain-containing protein [Litoribacterium kuwaitense]NGP46257.1 PH domain-containing protein [Litoribacterium kuwaitense]
MRTLPRQRIARDALKVWRLTAAITTIIGGVVVGLITGWTIWQSWPLWIAYTAIGLLVIFGVISIAVMPTLVWRRWRYEVREEEVELMKGVIITKRTLIPMTKVQHVDTIQGPFLKKYKLATVTVSTAATTHEIPALEQEEAEALRDQIARLARRVDVDE